MVEVVYEYECICWERFGVFCGIMIAHNFAMRILGSPGRQATILTYLWSIENSGTCNIDFFSI